MNAPSMGVGISLLFVVVELMNYIYSVHQIKAGHPVGVSCFLGGQLEWQLWKSILEAVGAAIGRPAVPGYIFVLAWTKRQGVSVWTRDARTYISTV
jgi:hypothetical protein